MANTKIPVELSSTPSIVDNGDATAITIDSSERVGIGVTPSDHSGYMLQITGGSQSFIAIGNDTTGTGALNGLIVGNDSTGADIYQRENQPLRFHTNNTEKMRLDSSGNVGIGTTSPFSKTQITETGWSSGAPYGTVLTVTGNNTNDANWGHLIISDSSTGTGNGGMLRFAVGSTSSDISPHAGIDGFTEGSNYGGLKFLTRANGGTATERMRIDASGNVGIGASPNANYRNDGSATEKYLQVGSAAVLFADSGITTALANNCAINNSDQRIALSGTNAGSMYEQYQGIHVFYNTNSVAAGNVQTMTARFTINSSGGSDGSDIKLKENIENISYGLDTVKSLQPRKFKWKEDNNDGIGFIAQEVESLIPELISEVYDNSVKPDTSEKTKMLNYSAMTAVLTKAIQEQQTLIETQQTTINDLKSRIETLEG